jgi:hypothetical protein
VLPWGGDDEEGSIGGARRRGAGSGAAMLGEDGEEVRRRSAGSGTARARASRQPGGGVRGGSASGQRSERERRLGRKKKIF